MKRIDKKTLITLSSLLFVITVLLSIGFSYAVWFVEITDSNTTVVGSDCLDLSFTEGEDISVDLAFPISDSEGMETVPFTFSLENICGMYAKYVVKLEILDTNTMPKELIKSNIDTMEPLVVSGRATSDDVHYDLLTKVIRPGESVTHEVRLWIDESGTKDNSMNKTISARVIVEYVPSDEDELLYLVNAACISDLESRGVTPNLDSDFTFTESAQEVTITDYVGTSKDVVIPCEINNKPVSVVGSLAFYNNQLTSVEIPISIFNINNWAFRSNEITNIKISNFVTGLGAYAFNDNQLTEINIPSSVINIEDGAFGSNLITEVFVPNTITTMGKEIFRGNKITKVVIEEGVTEIPEGMFYQNLINDLTLPSTLIKTNFKSFASNKLTTVNLPDGLTNIEQQSFISNQLTEIDIPSSVTTVGGYAFGSNKLTYVNIPSTLTSIGGMAFANNLITSYTLPTNMTVIPQGLFYENSLTNVIIPEHITEIDSWAFRGNEITSLEIANTVTKIEAYAFNDNQLTEINIPSSVITIEDGAFGSNVLTTINIEGKNSAGDFVSLGSNWYSGTPTINYLGS